jgi:hypothetical protein
MEKIMAGGVRKSSLLNENLSVVVKYAEPAPDMVR